MSYTTGIRSGMSNGLAVVFRCDDVHARYWNMRVFNERDDGRAEDVVEAMDLWTTDADGVQGTVKEVKIPAPVMDAIAEAFGDPDHRYQAKCRDLEAELARAHEIIKALTNALVPRS